MNSSEWVTASLGSKCQIVTKTCSLEWGSFDPRHNSLPRDGSHVRPVIGRPPLAEAPDWWKSGAWQRVDGL